MLDTKARERAETLFEPNQKREKEIGDVLKQEAARHAAAVANMHRLRALRLSRKSAAKIRQILAKIRVSLDVWAGANTRLSVLAGETALGRTGFAR
jgi:hypothetical protein